MGELTVGMMKQVHAWVRDTEAPLNAWGRVWRCSTQGCGCKKVITHSGRTVGFYVGGTLRKKDIEPPCPALPVMD